MIKQWVSVILLIYAVSLVFFPWENTFELFGIVFNWSAVVVATLLLISAKLWGVKLPFI